MGGCDSRIDLQSLEIEKKYTFTVSKYYDLVLKAVWNISDENRLSQKEKNIQPEIRQFFFTLFSEIICGLINAFS